MSLKFGTDGVRGVANSELTPELVLALGRAAARVLGHGPWVVGRDTRLSGPLLQAALSAGLAAEGASVVDLGVVPTPAVAHLSAANDQPGAVVSASHNPFPDNGVKFFAPGGRKLTDDVEEHLEAELRTILAAADEGVDARTGSDVGSITVEHEAVAAYVDHLHAALQGRSLEGMHVVVDAANGSASELAGLVFRRAGADVTVLHAQPDGTNINHGCGSTHPERLQEVVRDTDGVALGLALDGDADRVLAVAPDGELVDGDMILALSAIDLRDRGALAGNALVVTVMSNLGLRLAMRDAGIDVVETKVGDRYVLEALEDGGRSLGGEQSGHIIFRDLATTGDGLLTGLLLADIVARSGKSLTDLANGTMRRLPQVLKNVRVADRDAATGAPDVQRAVADVERRLGESGRVLLRPSGTEPVVRVMVEAPTHELAEEAVDEIVAVINPPGAAGPGSS